MMHLNIGDRAPDFNLENQEGEKRSLSSFKEDYLAVFFYPKDMTPGCTAEGINLKEHYEELQSHSINVVGVSADSVERHNKFVCKYEFPFDLLADEEKSMIMDYGVWGEKKFMGKVFDGIHRTTFILDKSRKIIEIIKKVKTKDHAAQILQALELVNK